MPGMHFNNVNVYMSRIPQTESGRTKYDFINQKRLRLQEEKNKIF